MKIARFCALMVSVVMVFCTLCSCGGDGAASEDRLRELVKEVYQIDGEGEKAIASMFEAFDREFEKMKALNTVGEKDLFQYADTVSKAFSSLSDSFSEAYEPDLGRYEGEEKVAAEDIVLEYASLLLASLDVTQEIGNYQLDNNGSGERCFESAVQLVNESSQFFYGTDRITDEALDALAEAFA